MNVSHKLFKKCGLVAALACPLAAALLWNPPGGLNATAQTPPPAASPGIVAGGLVGTNAPSGTNAPAATNAPSGTNSPVATNAPAGTNAPTGTNTVAGTNAPSGTNDGITVSFQGANVDMIAQWLAQTTGKNVVKHPRVQCQVTIMGGRKMPMRDALNLVYRALAVEGNTVTETSKSIIITPEGSEPKMSPELLSAGEVPEGKQRLVKVFALQHVQAADLKDKLKGLVSEKALIDIDEKGNRIMVTDYNDNIGLIKDLVTMLDTESPADVTLRMLPLKHVSAQNLAKEIQPLYQRMRERNPKEVVEISANDRSNSLLIMSSEPNFRSIERLVASLDTEEAQEKVMRAYMLKNADAQDVAKQLKDLYNTSDDGGGVTYYRYIYADQSSGNSKKSSFVADRRRNAVIVQAPLSAIDPIEEMIKALDEPVNDDNLAPKIYQLKYVSAGDIEDILNELFLKKTQRSYYYSDDYYMSASTDRDVGRLYGKVRITSEPYANVIIITANSAENLGAVEDVVKQLDVPSQAGDTTMRVQLKFAKATDVSSSLNILFAKNGSPAFGQGSQNQQRNAGQQQNQNQGQGQNTSSQGVDFQLEPNAKEEGYFPWLGGQPDSSSGFGGSDSKSGSRPVSDLVGRVRVVPDQRINAILISANIHLFPEVVKLVEQMDEPTAQVLIEAKILEVSSDLLNSLGVRWSPDGSKSFSTDDYDMSLMPKLTGTQAYSFAPCGEQWETRTTYSSSLRLRMQAWRAPLSRNPLLPRLPPLLACLKANITLSRASRPTQSSRRQLLRRRRRTRPTAPASPRVAARRKLPQPRPLPQAPGWPTPARGGAESWPAPASVPSTRQC